MDYKLNYFGSVRTGFILRWVLMLKCNFRRVDLQENNDNIGKKAENFDLSVFFVQNMFHGTFPRVVSSNINAFQKRAWKIKC